MIKIRWSLIVICLLAACQANDDPVATNKEKTERVQYVKQSVKTPENKNLSATDIAENLVTIAKQVPDVNDATAIVTGKYAVVGIDVNQKLDRSRVSSIKYTVAEALQKDPYGANAVITADADTTYRLKQMATEIKRGHPIGGVMEELADIVGRLMPEVPSKTNKSEPDPVRSNDKQIPAKEEKQLKQQQEKQDLDK
ncbi:YhcN/YlaJ family sporulation lipoprotein [Guptibacillus hwajinpoensis]|uniref:YhcN/YlaJ family sporulation lipoprotein n=1 Tax=Guptibacillus hwajinpoensis TaxID=208199 RepID=UPI00188476E4|nr:YhcN/YlaJ family sporulation lipoprotein [Pseudalkalibacillus hwajinpoensis]MBF0708299.1 YhcN/YlaJ family sporulation lipoprotein [Pseudalkalibacillus hwajinpoensis]